MSETSKVEASDDHLQFYDAEEVLEFVNVKRGYDQDSLGWFREVDTRWPPYLEVFGVGEYVAKTAPCLCDSKVCVLDLSGDKEDPYALCIMTRG